jgi:hypothetical protein
MGITVSARDEGNGTVEAHAAYETSVSLCLIHVISTATTRQGNGSSLRWLASTVNMGRIGEYVQQVGPLE